MKKYSQFLSELKQSKEIDNTFNFVTSQFVKTINMAILTDGKLSMNYDWQRWNKESSAIYKSTTSLNEVTAKLSKLATEIFKLSDDFIANNKEIQAELKKHYK